MGMAGWALFARAEAGTASGSFAVTVNVIDRCTIQSVAAVSRGMPLDAATAATARCTGAQAYDVAVARESVAPVVSTSRLTGSGEGAQSPSRYVLFADAAHGGALGGSVEVDSLARAGVAADRGVATPAALADTGDRPLDAVRITVSF